MPDSILRFVRADATRTVIEATYERCAASRASSCFTGELVAQSRRTITESHCLLARLDGDAL